MLCGQRWQSGSPQPFRFPLQDELARIGAHRPLVFRYHVVGCRQLRSQDLLEEGYVTTLSGHPLRFSERAVSQAPPQMSRPPTQGSPASARPLPACPVPTRLGPSHFPGPERAS